MVHPDGLSKSGLNLTCFEQRSVAPDNVGISMKKFSVRFLFKRKVNTAVRGRGTRDRRKSEVRKTRAQLCLFKLDEVGHDFVGREETTP